MNGVALKIDYMWQWRAERDSKRVSGMRDH